MANRRFFAQVALTAFSALLLSDAASAQTAPKPTVVDLSGFNPDSAVQVHVKDNLLQVRWPAGSDQIGSLKLNLDTATPLISEIGIGKGADIGTAITPILKDFDPSIVLTVGTRDLKPAGWIVFFDNPYRRPYTSHTMTLSRETMRVVQEGGHTSILIAGAKAGPFEGQFKFTIYPGSPLVRAATVISTQREATAFLFDAGLVSKNAQTPWKSIAWTDLTDKLVRTTGTDSARAPQVRYRTIIAENDAGSLAMVPPPHQYFYPLDEVDNLNSTWVGSNYRGLEGIGFGVRQTIEGDRRFVPWVNAPPGTQQDCGVFYLLSDGDATKTTADVLTYTREDVFKPLPGYNTFTSHYHVEHAVRFATEQKRQAATGVPAGLEYPEFVDRFKKMGVNIVHLGELHLPADAMRIAPRLELLRIMHEECARLSDDTFLLLPGEEPNVHLGGHWVSFFPKPVYWTLDRQDGQPFVEKHPVYDKVYHVGNAADVLQLMQEENGLMWVAHGRIKSSTGFPDVYKNRDYFKSDHYLGAAWKAMPADYSQPRLGSRILDLMDDMNNWGAKKQAIGEVDVFFIDNKSELYAHMNINYLRLPTLPNYKDGWQPVLDTIRKGAFFTTTGEVLIPGFTIDGKQSGETLTKPTGLSTLKATVEWTFPPAYAEVVSGDCETIHRQKIDLTELKSFGSKELSIEIDLRGRTWARIEAWDVAQNGAYTQPVWIRQ